ncbi:MAG: hypothetical protein ACXW1W_09955 [Methylococcaceae bacterium]
MTEILFILTTIYVAYVAYSIVNEQRTSASQPSETHVEIQEVVKDSPKPVVVSEEQPAVAAKKTKASVATPNPGRGTVRDPKTGEVATITGNYRFTKRWIKEALVTEGLLEKVYKNNELDAETEAAIKEAMAKLEAMDGYRA